MYLPEKIRFIRKRWGMNQQVFATLFELNKHNISGYESGKYEPSVSFLVHLAEWSSVSVQSMFRRRLENSEIAPAPGTPEASKLQEAQAAYQKLEKSPEGISEAPQSDLLNMTAVLRRIAMIEQNMQEMRTKIQQLEAKHE